MKIFGIISIDYMLCFVAYSFFTAFAAFNDEYISTEQNYISIVGAIICIVLAVINAALSRKNKK